MADDFERVVAEGEEHFEDLDLTIRWAAKPYVLEFAAKQGTKQDDGSICYFYFPNGTGANEPTDDFAQAERFVEGGIKWDGCSHVSFGTEEGYVHLCGASCFRAMMFALDYAFRLAAKHVPHWDVDTAGELAVRSLTEEEKNG